MAFKTGIANNTADFMAILLDFIQNDPTLVADGQNWRIAWEATSGAQVGKDYVVAGPGMMGVETFVALQMVNSDTNNQGLWLRMVDGVNPVSVAYDNHMNVSPRVGVATDVNAFTYWMMANGRRFMFIIKISTNYQHGYAGMFLQYNQPQRYPNPQMVGGSINNYDSLNWRQNGDAALSFTRPELYRPNNNYENMSTLCARKATNEYGMFAVTDNDCTLGPWAYGVTSFQGAANSQNNYYGHRALAVMIAPTLDSNILLQPLTLSYEVGGITLAGIIDGVKMVNGEGQYSENVITENGVDYLVVQDGLRVGSNRYSAWAME